MSTTYHIWHHGQDQGPYTREEMIGMLSRGELAEALWRRTDGSGYHPIEGLIEEVAQGPKSPKQPRRVSWVGGFFGGAGGIVAATGALAIFLHPLVGISIVVLGLALLAAGLLFERLEIFTQRFKQ